MMCYSHEEYVNLNRRKKSIKSGTWIVDGTDYRNPPTIRQLRRDLTIEYYADIEEWKPNLGKFVCYFKFGTSEYIIKKYEGDSSHTIYYPDESYEEYRDIAPLEIIDVIKRSEG